MKIIIVSTPIFKLPLAGYGGLEHLAWQRAAGLAAKGHQVALVAPDGSECPGVTIIPIGAERQCDEQMAYGGYGEVKEGEVVKRRAHAGGWQVLNEADVIIDETWLKYSYMLKMEGKLKAPILGVCHAPINTMYSALPPVEKPCFVCISEDQASHFRALFNADCRVCRNGIDLDTYKPLGIPRTNRFLFVARFSSVKGPDLAIAACKEANVGLDMIGDTSITNEPELLQQCLASVNGSEQIKILGGRPRGECVWWMSQAHAFLHPGARFREPLGLAPLEAQACGLPVIAFDYGALRETVKNHETGLLCKTQAEFVNAVSVFAGRDQFGNFSLPDKIRGQCREWASEFSLPKMINRVEELCVEAVDTGGW